MLTNITVPTNIRSQTKLSIGRWFKKIGDPVTLDDPLVEIDTDNVTHEIQAPVTGVLSQILVKDGASVEPNAVLGIITEY
jgi:pyruvate/2-oxoglutarate dehydrogenase complex dihydrolipoamide acyltransferase (E2) component